MGTDVAFGVACWALGCGAQAALDLGVLGALGHCLSWENGAQVHLSVAAWLAVAGLRMK